MTDPNKKSLAIVSNNITSFRGGEIFVLSTLKRLKQEFNITILNLVSKSDIERRTRHEIAKEYDLKDVNIIDIDTVPIKARAFGDTDYNLLLPKPVSFARLVSEVGRNDIIYNTSSSPAVLSLIVMASKISGRKLVQGIHNLYPLRAFSGKSRGSIPAKLYRSVLGNIEYFHTLNTTDFKNIKSNIPGANVYLIPHFLMFKHSKVYTNKDKFIVIFAGGLTTFEKGLDLLSSIIDKTLAKNKNILFYIVGSGEGDKIIKKVRDRHKKNVTWFGFLKPSILDKKYGEANLYISTSRFEAFALTVVEAQAHGLPVVAFDAAGPKSIIKKGFQGVCVKDFDTDVFVRQIVSYYNLWHKDRRHYNLLKAKISKNILEKYSYDKIIEELVEMLNSVAGK